LFKDLFKIDSILHLFLIITNHEFWVRSYSKQVETLDQKCTEDLVGKFRGNS